MIIEGRVELEASATGPRLFSQPVVLQPGASVGPPGSGSYIANPGTIAVTFAPMAGPNPGAGSYSASAPT